MNLRDKAILADLSRFRVLDRDQIISLHFSNLRQAITTCNRVMQRLALKGLVKADISKRPYQYMLAENKMKFSSSKVPHFKAIADFFVDLCKYERPTVFEVEPKLTAKGGVEPDVYCVWKGRGIFIEIQRSRYTAKVMQLKINRYQDYYLSREWKALRETFPLIWIISDQPYTKIETDTLRVVQSRSVQDYMSKAAAPIIQSNLKQKK